MSILELGYGPEAAIKENPENEDMLFFTTDTMQIFKGYTNYTKNVTVLNFEPTQSFTGSNGQLYFYGNKLYLCTVDASGTCNYTILATKDSEVLKYSKQELTTAQQEQVKSNLNIKDISQMDSLYLNPYKLVVRSNKHFSLIKV